MEWIVPKGGVEMKKSVVSLFLLVLIVIMNFVGCTESENFGDVKNRMCPEAGRLRAHHNEALLSASR